MSFHKYLDEEFLKIQDFLSVLTDTLPKVDPSAVKVLLTLSLFNIKDDQSLIRALLDQNKAYGRKIVSLYENLDSLYKNQSMMFQQSNMDQNPDFSARLHQKIQDYEELIKRLTIENDEFNQQIRQISKQMETLQYQYQNSQTGSREKSISQTASPLGRKSTGKSGRDISFDLESLFLNAEYNKALDLLAQMDYRKPQSVSYEKFTNWLVSANRIRDTQINEILNKLKILITFSDHDGVAAEEHNLEDSLDGHTQKPVIDRIYSLLDDKIPKLILQSEYKIENQKMLSQNEQLDMVPSVHWSTAQFKQLKEMAKQEDDGDFNVDQLRLKIRYLNHNLHEAEKKIREKEIEVEILKDKIKDQHSIGSPQVLQSEKETLIETLSSEMDARFQAEANLREVVQENQNLERKIEAILNELEISEKKYMDLNNHLEENNDVIRKLIEENTLLKEQFEFSEKLEDIDKLREILNEKESKIKSLQEELTSTKITPRERPSIEPKRYISDTPSESRATTRENKNTHLESALLAQTNAIHSTKSVFNELRSRLTEALSQQNLGVPQTAMTTAEDLSSISSELLKTVKSNTYYIKELYNDLKFANVAVSLLISDDELNKSEHSMLVGKIAHAEEKLVQNLSTALGVLQQTTHSVHEASKSSNNQAELSRAAGNLQNLQDMITKAMQEFPEFSNEYSIEKKTLDFSGSKTGTFVFKEKLLQDQQDINSRLKSSLKHVEQNLNNEAFGQLANEIEKSQALQDKLESRSLIIHRMNLIFNEGVDRANSSLDQLIKLADSEYAQRLLSFILNEISTIKNKFKEIISSTREAKNESMRDYTRLEQEYAVQRENWERILKEIVDLNEEKLEQFIKEIEAERDAHQKTYTHLLSAQKKSRISDEAMNEIHLLRETIADKEHALILKREEVDTMTLKLRTLETQVDHMTKEMQRWKESVSTAENEKSAITAEYQKVRERLTSHTRGHDELVTMNNKLKLENEDQRITIEQLRKENHTLIQQINDHVNIKGKELDYLTKQIEGLKLENADLRGHREKTELIVKKNYEQLEALKLSYFTDINNLKEEKDALTEERYKLISELERRNTEIIKLNQMLDSLQGFSNKQLENFKSKEEKITELHSIRREHEITINDLERKVKELTEKNQKYNEVNNELLHDITNLKQEISSIISKHEEVQRDLIVSKAKCEEYSSKLNVLEANERAMLEAKNQIEERILKLNEIMQITKQELKNARESNEEKNRELQDRDREILSLKDILKRDRESTRDSDLVLHLKKELKTRNEEIESLKNQISRNREMIEKLNIDLDTLRATNRLHEQHLRESDKSNAINQNLSIEIENLRKGNRYKEEQHVMEKEAYEREIDLLKKKVSDLKSIIDNKDSALKGLPKGLEDSQRSHASSGSGQVNSSYFNSVIESKDLEIRRLTQIVKNLTENLKDTQESKYKLRK